jgi:drug/metabolite transporter (DMT)-like permease
VGASSLVVEYPVLTGQALRYGLATALLLALTQRLGPLIRPSRREALQLALLSSVGLGAFNVFLVLALRSSEPAATAVVVGAVPVALAVVGPLQLGLRPRRALVVAAAAVVLGAAVVQGTGRASLTGLMLALGALACECFFTLAAVPLLPRLGAMTVSTVGCALAAVELAVLGRVVHGPGWLPAPTPSELAALAYLATAVTAVAFVLWYSAVAHVGAEVAGLCAGLVPVAGAVTGWGVGTGSLEPVQMLGVMVILIAITGAVWATRRSSNPQARG